MCSATAPYHYERFLPAGPLAAMVKFFYYFCGQGSGPERILPMSLTEITFQLNMSGTRSFIVPSGNQPYFVIPETLDKIIGICFYPWGLHTLFNVSPGQLGEHKLSLHDALPVAAREMTECLKLAGSPGEMISHLEAYLTGRIGNCPDPLIGDAVGFIDGRHGLVDLRELYRRYSYSERRLQLLFERSIGMSPKKYSRLKRFHYAVTRLTPGIALTSLALDTGYYDQPHFIHEFKTFSGTHPKQFLKERNELNAINARSWF